MTAKHASSEWKATTRTIRAQARRAHHQGNTVVCWRCGRGLPVDAENRLVFDVGHLDPNGGEAVSNAAPEHRAKSPYCIGNRAHGGRMGAAKTNAKRSAKSTFHPIPWA